MALISNQWVAELSERIFAHTSAFNTDIPMAGRQEPLASLRGILTEKGGARCAVMSELLGAGKTFFLQQAFSELVKEGAIDEEMQSARLVVNDVSDGSVPAEAAHARIIIIEELDRKADRYELETAVEAVSRWLGDDRKAILTGDFSLRDPELLNILGEEVQVRRIPLEPLDQKLLVEAVQLRLYHWLRGGGLAHVEAEAAAAEAAPHMFDPALLEAVVPPTDPPIATFREVLGLLQKMAVCLPLDTQSCRFTPDTFREWTITFSRGRRWTDEQRAFVDALNQTIRDRAQHNSPWQPLGMEELLEVIPRAQDFGKALESEILEPLVRTGVLLPMGIPYSDPMQEKAIRGPYLPSVHTFATALLS